MCLKNIFLTAATLMQALKPQPTQKAAAHEEAAPPVAHGEEDVPKAPKVSRPESKLQGMQLIQCWFIPLHKF